MQKDETQRNGAKRKEMAQEEKKLSIPSFYTEKVGHSKSGHFSMYYSTTIKN
jgi:hypothetical protein